MTTNPWETEVKVSLTVRELKAIAHLLHSKADADGEFTEWSVWKSIDGKISLNITDYSLNALEALKLRNDTASMILDMGKRLKASPRITATIYTAGFITGLKSISRERESIIEDRLNEIMFPE